MLRGSGERKPKEPAPDVSRVRSGATFAIVVLTAMNLLNYVDRWVPSAVKPLFKRALHFSDAETSYPTTAFIVVYLAASPLFGALADKHQRKRLIAVGVGLWSLATASGAFAVGFKSFLVSRAAVGVGEAAYATLSPAVLSDFYPAGKRNRILTIFYLAIPVGSALGYWLGGKVGTSYGWRAAFLITGLPGLLTALVVLLMREPARGACDADKPQPISWPKALSSLSRNRVFVVAVLGYTAVTFASGALADWFPTFLYRDRGISLADADLLVGATGALGGLIGTFAGGFLADRLRRHTRQPYFALSGVSMALATAFAIVALLVHGYWPIAGTILVAQILLWFYNGPINALIVNAVGANLRARAVAVSILCIHLFGDALSPSIVGLVSDRTRSLPLALSMVPVALAVGAVVWLAGWRLVPASTDPLRHAAGV